MAFYSALVLDRKAKENNCSELSAWELQTKAGRDEFAHQQELFPGRFVLLFKAKTVNDFKAFVKSWRALG